MDKQKIDVGVRKYDRFVEKIIGNLDITIMTPHTKTLERLAGLEENTEEFIEVAINELVENFRT